MTSLCNSNSKHFFMIIFLLRAGAAPNAAVIFFFFYGIQNMFSFVVCISVFVFKNFPL